MEFGYRIFTVGGKYNMIKVRDCGLSIPFGENYLRLKVHSLRANSIPTIELYRQPLFTT